jgi:nucleoside-diphosphate-sugar epimerase
MFGINDILRSGLKIMAKRVSILGCGWFGGALAEHLISKGYDVSGSCTSQKKAAVLQMRGIPAYEIKVGEDLNLLDPNSNFWQCDALIIASNVKLAGNASYISGMKKVVEVIKSRQVKQLILVSSTSVYGEPDQVVDECAVCNPETASAAVLLDLEASFQAIAGIQSTALRFGGLVGPGRLPGTFFAGKKGVSNGLAPVNLIHLEDCLAVTTRLLQQDELPAIVNAVAPDHPSRAEFYGLAAEMQHLVVPQFISERLNWKVVKSSFLEDIGYDFLIKDWEAWLKSL